MVEVFSNGGFTTRPEISGVFGCAAATHWLAAATAMRILEAGGNAFDAAVSAGFALQVLEPHLNGPAGEVPILLWNAGERQARSICGQGVSPQAATMEAFAELGLDMVPGTGMRSACVPGAFGAWLMLLRDHGTMRLADVLAPAIEYAEGGFPLNARVSQTIASMREVFATRWPASLEVYFPHGRLPEAGQLFRNRDLAATYRRVLRESAGGDRETEIARASACWYEGFVAEAIDAACRAPEPDAAGTRAAGFLTGDDMAAWQPTYETPLTREYAGVDVWKCGAWTQGPALLQWLGLLEGTDVASLDPDGPDFVHLVTEAGKLAMADRDAWLGDVDAPVEDLLSRGYIDRRRSLIGELASEEWRPGEPGGRTPVLPPIRLPGDAGAAAGAGEPTFSGVGEPTFGQGGGSAAPGRGDQTAAARAAQLLPGDTCHIAVVDRHGNMVAATPSGGWFQASPVIAGLGFPLNTRAQMFWLKDGLPSSLRPRRRPRTTLTPTLVTRDGEPALGFGTPGGDQQEQWSVAFLLRHLHHGANLQQAIDAPAFHSNHLIASFWPRTFEPAKLVMESRFGADVGDALAARGHQIKWTADWALGRLCAVARQHVHGDVILKAAANPRGMQDYAVGR